MAELSDAEDEDWCNRERDRVIAYLRNEGLNHGKVGNWPAWHVAPYLAVWAIESLKNPGWVGWWAISGDLPTDYTTCGPERHPREGIRDIATRWKHAAECWARNGSVDRFRIGAAEDMATIAPPLAVRAELLLSFASDDALWEQ
jgi:hypothetical protein